MGEHLPISFKHLERINLIQVSFSQTFLYFGMIKNWKSEEEFLLGKSESETRQKLFEEVVRTLEMRWIEIDDPLIFAGLMYYVEYFTDLFLARIEDKMTNKAGDLSSEEIIAILKALAFKKRRPTALIKV